MEGGYVRQISLTGRGPGVAAGPHRGNIKCFFFRGSGSGA
jgi:hypothetical protein